MNVLEIAQVVMERDSSGSELATESQTNSTVCSGIAFSAQEKGWMAMPWTMSSEKRISMPPKSNPMILANIGSILNNRLTINGVGV